MNCVSGHQVDGLALYPQSDGLRLVERIEPRVEIETSSHYIRRNRLLIVADAFGIDDVAAAGLLDDPGKRAATP